MEVFFPDVALVWSLMRLVGDGLTYHLYTNDHSPTLLDTLDDFTEAFYSGYAPIQVLPDDWASSGVANHLGGLHAPNIVYHNISPSPVDIFGYFVTDLAGTQLVCAARLDIAPEHVVPGANIVISPILGSYSGLEP